VAAENLRRKNSFIEVSKNLARSKNNLDHQNNYVGYFQLVVRTFCGIVINVL